MPHVLEARLLRKKYGNVQALKELSLAVPAGSIFGILGPNGSGKTTCLSIFLDVIKADSGTFEWFNEGNSHFIRRRKIGALIETPNFYPYLSAVDNLNVIANIKKRGSKNIQTVLQLTGLAKRRNSKFSSFSLGMKQRLAIAASLLSSPEVLVLDEPTNGLDPQGIAEIRQLIKDIGSEGKTIILASHLLDEVEKVCTHVAILKSGSLLAAGDVKEVIGNQNIVEISAENLDALYSAAKEMTGISAIEKQQDKLILKFSGDGNQTIDAANFNRFFFDKGIAVNYLCLKKRSLETHFLELTSNAKTAEN